MSTTVASTQDIDLESLSNEELRALVKQQLAIIESKRKLGLNFTFEADGSIDSRNLGTPGMVPHLVKKPALSTLTAFGAEDHILIEGDNLPAVTAYLTAGGCPADVIYIDPPYNTGDDGSDGSFVYNDRRVSSKDAYYHSAWLSFMLPRLVLGKEALRETGIIIVHIGPDEVHRLRMLMDEVLGEENFIAMVTWGGSMKNDSRFFSATSDYALIYSKNKNNLVENGVTYRAAKPGATDMLDAASSIWSDVISGGKAGKAAAFEATKRIRAWYKTDAAETARLYKGNKGYLNIDEEGKLYQPADLRKPAPTAKSRYELLHPVTGFPVPMHPNGWVYAPDTMQKKLAEGRILFGKDHTVSPRYKRYLTDVMSGVQRDVLMADRERASTELSAIIGKGPDGKPLFNNPKDRTVLAQWIDYVTPQFRKDESATDPIVVMDFFAGSGSTGHAVLDLNAQDDVRRKFVLVTNNEDPKAEDDNPDTGVARDVTSKRLRAAITGEWADGKKRDGYKANLHYYRQTWADFGTDVYQRASQFQGRFEGLASIASGAYWTERDLKEFGIETPASERSFSVIRSPHDGGTTLLVWNDYVAVRDDSGEGFLDEPSGIIANYFDEVQDTHRIAYIPTVDGEVPFGIEGATQVRSYPDEYLTRLQAMVAHLVSTAGLRFN